MLYYTRILCTLFHRDANIKINLISTNIPCRSNWPLASIHSIGQSRAVEKKFRLFTTGFLLEISMRCLKQLVPSSKSYKTATSWTVTPDILRDTECTAVSSENADPKTLFKWIRSLLFQTPWGSTTSQKISFFALQTDFLLKGH